jgi:hypothetical protein
VNEGHPETYHSDNAKNFDNPTIRASMHDVMVAVHQLMGDTKDMVLRLIHGLPYNPQCQGLVERKNSVVKRKLTAHVRDLVTSGVDRADLEMRQCVGHVISGENHSPNSRSYLSPFMVLRCRDRHNQPINPQDIQKEVIKWQRIQGEGDVKRAKDKADIHRARVVFKIGDRVRVNFQPRTNKPGGAKKWDHRGVITNKVIVDGATNDPSFRVRWTTKGLGTDPIGSISTRVFKGSRHLVMDTVDEEVTVWHKPAANVTTNIDLSGREIWMHKKHFGLNKGWWKAGFPVSDRGGRCSSTHVAGLVLSECADKPGHWSVVFEMGTFVFTAALIGRHLQTPSDLTESVTKGNARERRAAGRRKSRATAEPGSEAVRISTPTSAHPTHSCVLHTFRILFTTGRARRRRGHDKRNWRGGRGEQQFFTTHALLRGIHFS